MDNEYLSSDFSYKKYSLEQLDNWVNDALNCEDLTPQNIYDTVVKCVDESVEYHKKYLTKSIELLSLLKGHRSVDFDVTDKDWENFWEENYYPEESHQYTEEELNAMCDAAAEQEEKEKCREYNMREAEYYNKRAELDFEYEAIRAAGGYEWTPESSNEKLFSTQNGVTYNEYMKAKNEAGSSWNDGWTKKHYQNIVDKYEGKVKKWILPVCETKISESDETEYFVSLPDDLLEVANLKEGDEIQFIDNDDGSYTITKVTKPLRMDEC